MNNENYITLRPRLKKIAELVPPCNAAADIGTDHAYIPVQLLLSDKAKYVIASDIKKGPVSRAKKTVEKYHLEGEIDVRLGAGLSTVAPNEAEVVIIAGMGGILISDILKQSQDTVRAAKLLILQPMTAVYELREYLSKNNYSVENEYLVQEEDKIYNIIVVKTSGNNPYTLKELYLGKGLDKTAPALYDSYQRGVITKLKKRANGLEKSNLDKNRLELNKILDTIQKITENQQEDKYDQTVRNN